jgi:uncharacterized protein
LQNHDKPRDRFLATWIYLMKTKLCLLILVLAATLARAQTNDLASLLQQGLLEEQANRNLDAAITDYQALATQFDKNRQIAATAIFRLGECYRMQGRTNEAAAQYQRILSDFSDQQTLATMSREDLTGMGMAANGATGAESAAQQPAEAPVEIRILEAQIAGIEKLKSEPEEQARAVQAIFPDDDLKAMLEILPGLQEQMTRFKANPQLTIHQAGGFLKAVGKRENSISQFIDATGKYQHDTSTNAVGLAEFHLDLQNFLIRQQVNFILGNQNARLKALQSANNSVPAVTDEEDQEIQRIQTMIQNSPDLINASGGALNPLTRAVQHGWIKVANYLLAHGADVNANNSEVLFNATRDGNRTMVEWLLSHDADVNTADPIHSDETPLHIAAENNFPAVVEVLLANKADMNAKNSYDKTPLFAAVEANHPEIVKLLLDAGANPDLEDMAKRTPLGLAVNNNRLDIIRLLLAQRADVNLKESAGNSSLMNAVWGNWSERVKLLLAAGANVNMENDQGRTALSYAAENGSPEIVKLLLAAQADPNGGKCDAPLLAAIKKKDAASAELLLQAGANANLKGDITWADGEAASGWTTPLYSAVTTGQLPMVQLLLKFKADPDGPVATITPLLFKALSDTNILEALLHAGAKPDVRDSASTFNGRPINRTPLLQAVQGGFSDGTVQILLNHGANPNARESIFGYSPLIYAAYNLSDTNVFLALLKHNADPNTPDNYHETALSIIQNKMAGSGLALDRKALAGELADLLRQHGALDKLPDWNTITVSRPPANFSKQIFWKGTNDWNQFTLLETLVEFYGPPHVRPLGTQNNSFIQVGFQPTSFQSLSQDSMHLSFPDLAHITIVRPQPDSTNETRIEVNLLNNTNGIDCAKDVPLQFGDVVEIPEYNHPLASAPIGVPDAQFATMGNFLDGKVELMTPDQKMELPFRFYTGGSLIGWVLSDTGAQKVLESSSDLSRVKVTRRDPTTGKTRSWILDCSDLANAPGLRVRDGDVIEVPERPQ